MIKKKIIFLFFSCLLLGGCASPTAMLGPAYSITSTGNVYQAGLSYGSNQMITYYTGKTPIENLKEITLSDNENSNIQKNALESEDFEALLTNRIKKTRSIINLSNQ